MLANNLATAAILTTVNAGHGLDVIERRIACLRGLGEDQRNTASWRDAVAELAEFGRAVSCRTWHLRTAAAL